MARLPAPAPGSERRADNSRIYASRKGVSALTADGLEFDLRSDSSDRAPEIDLPLWDHEPPHREEEAAEDVPLQDAEAPQTSSGHGFAIGMLVLGLLSGFVGGFVASQRMSALTAPVSAADVPRPLAPPPAQNYTDSIVTEPRRSVAIEQPEVQLPATPPSDGAVAPAVSRPDDQPAPNTPAVQPAIVEVASRPAGAIVYVDDVPVGSTPITLRNVASGAHRVRLELTDYRSWTTDVHVEAASRMRIGASLTR